MFHRLGGVLLVLALLCLPRTGLGQTPNGVDSSSKDASHTRAPSGSHQTRTVLWIFRYDEISPEARDDFRRGLGEALDSGRRTHLLSARDLRRHLKRRSADVPRCLQGVEACETPRTVVYEQLGVNLAVHVDLERTGEQLRASYEALDRRCRVNRTSTLTGEQPRELAFALARDLFDAAGRVSIRSEPPGATVLVDGETVGETPLDLQLPVGEHAYVLRHPDYRRIEGTFELTSAGSKIVRHQLQQQPGRLQIAGAPSDAAVYVRDQRVGPVGERLELEPGRYTIEVRADGYVPYRGSIEIEPDTTTDHEVSMTARNPLLRDVPSEAIAVNHYMARLSFEQTVHPTTFRDARGWLEGREYEFVDFAAPNGAPTSTLVRPVVSPSGLRADLVYTWRRLGVTALSVSYLAGWVGRRATLESEDGAERRIAEIRTLHRLELRPLQVSYRHLFGNFAPFAELGTGITFQWFRADHPAFESPLTMHRTEPFWTIGGGVQYFFKPRWFLQVRYGLQDYFNFGRGVEHTFNLGAGLALPNIFGFEPEPPEEL